MTTPEDHRTPAPHEPQNSADTDPDVAKPAEPATPPAPAVPLASPATPTTEDQTKHAKHYRQRAGQKVTAVLTGAATLVSKVRAETPKKIREAREKRVAGRHVILTEVDGRQVAIGPYSNDQAAHQDTVKVTGVPQVIELRSQTAYFGTGDGESGTPRRP
jgi:hypothetical protein